MSLNIKNERVHELIKLAATRTGLSQTSVVEAAITRFLDELDAPAGAADRVEQARRISVEFRQGLTDDDLSRLSPTPLYDEHGLPA